MVTTPRVFGYVFNPLTIYFCYSAPASVSPSTPADLNGPMLCIVLEVSNTFHEKHVYLCTSQNELQRESIPKTRRNEYTLFYEIVRSFHVSPFNSRKGKYQIALVDPTTTGTINLRLLITQGLSPVKQRQVHEHMMEPDHVPDHKILMADLKSKSGYALSNWNLICTFLKYPLTVFLTQPRVIYQAAKLAYQKHIPVYARPPLFSMNPINYAGARLQAGGPARSVRSRRPSPLVLRLLANLLHAKEGSWTQTASQLSVDLIIADPIGETVVETPLEGMGAQTCLIVQWRDWEAFESLSTNCCLLCGIRNAFISHKVDIDLVTTDRIRWSPIRLTNKEKNIMHKQIESLTIFLRIVTADTICGQATVNTQPSRILATLLPFLRKFFYYLNWKQDRTYLHESPHRAIPVESYLTSQGVIQDAKMLWKILFIFITQFLSRVYFHHFANFVHAPLDLSNRLKWYLGESTPSKPFGKSTMPVDYQIDADQMTLEEIQRFHQFNNALEMAFKL
jgi:DUF1365 family protein